MKLTLRNNKDKHRWNVRITGSLYHVYSGNLKWIISNFKTTGQYGGIGALIRRVGDFAVVSEPYEGFRQTRQD